jgi:hypothetical protein
MNENNFVGYEYQDVIVANEMASVYTDGYENFGWKLEGTSTKEGKIGSVVLKFKRNRKIRNKAELTRFQRQFDACVSEIEALNFSKGLKASAIAYVIGVIGTTFMAGSVFAVTSDQIMRCIVMAIPGFIGWIIPYPIFRKMKAKKTKEVTPLIDNKYDEIYSICEKANSLLN